MNNGKIIFDCVLELLSPVHIGGSEGKISPMDYVILEKDCYFINSDRFAKKLKEKNLIDQFSNWISNQELSFLDKKGNLKPKSPIFKGFLTENKLLERDFLKEISSNIAQKGWEIAPNNSAEIFPQIRDAKGYPFIPGSSIKGFLRNAICFNLLKEAFPNDKGQTWLTEKVNTNLSDMKGIFGSEKKKKDFTKKVKKEIEEGLFQAFSLKGREIQIGPHTDLLRCIEVGDAFPKKKAGTFLLSAKVFSKNPSRDDVPKKYYIYIECLPPKNHFYSFSLKVNSSILNSFEKPLPGNPLANVPMKRIREIVTQPLECISSFIIFLKGKEKIELTKIFDNFSELVPDKNKPGIMIIDGANCRIGWGGGLLFTTLSALLDDPTRTKLRNELWTNKGDTPAPKSRRIAIVPQEGCEKKMVSFGWCKLTLEKKND